MLGPDVAVQGYFGGISSRAVIVGAVDGLFEFFLGPLPIADLLELGNTVSEVVKSTLNFSYKLSEDVLDSIDLGNQIIGLGLHSL